MMLHASDACTHSAPCPEDLGALACASKSFSFLRENSVIQRAVEAFKGRCSDIDLEQAATEKDGSVFAMAEGC